MVAGNVDRGPRAVNTAAQSTQVLSRRVRAVDIAATIIGLLRQRAPTASVCPSDAARHLAGGDGEWRELMQPVRDVAARLASEGVLTITQGERQLDPQAINEGAVRLRRGPAFPLASGR
jgi:hypothetical protein